MPADIIAAPARSRPRTIEDAIDDHVADVAGAQLLRLGRKPEKRIDLSVGEKLHRPGRGARHPMNVLGRIEPDMGGHDAQENVLARIEIQHTDVLSLEV